MSDKEREAFRLRAIRVSALAALRGPMPVENRDAVIDRADQLLAELKERVIRDGGDETIIAMIEETRRDVRGG